MAQYLATNYYTGDGETGVWYLAFAGQNLDTGDGTAAYIKEEDVRVAFVTRSTDGSETLEPAEFTLTSPSTVRISPVPADGQLFKIYRATENEAPLVDFNEFASLQASDLDTAVRQSLFLVQELMDSESSKFPGIFSALADHVAALVAEERARAAADANLQEQMDSESSKFPGIFSALADHVAALVAEERARAAADANLQEQISGTQPLESQERPVVLWHKQVIENSLDIPEDRNARSYGPTVRIAEGQVVRVGEGSTWTISDGYTE